MRIRTLILCLLCCVASALAKDVITKTDGTKLDVKVEEITETVIKYRKASNPTGPVYTIPLTSVATILYENGDTDIFNEPQTTPNTQYISSSDEEPTRIQSYSNQTDIVSDTELVRMINGKTLTEELYDKAFKYKKIAWIGGCSLVAMGTLVGILRFELDPTRGDTTFRNNCRGVGFVSGVIAGAAWCIGFNLWANSLIKQAREMELYSATLIKNEIFNFGDKSITAGVDLIGNRMTHSHTIGLSLGFNF